MDDVQALRQEILLRANDLYEKREYARAAEVAQELLTVLPEDVEMRYVLAAALTQTGAYEAARAEVARIRAVCPDHAGAARQGSISTAQRGSSRRRSRICARWSRC